MSDDREPPIGALWQHEGRQGRYFTGSVTIDGTELKIVVFENTRRQNERAPHFRIFKSRPKTEAVDVAPF